jgi:hypothetical protein
MRVATARIAMIIGAFWVGSGGEGRGGFATNPALRLESDSGLMLDASGRVVSWADLSGNGHHASQADETARPLAVAGAFQGQVGLRFDGAGDFLNLAGQVLTSQQYSIFAVVTDRSTSTYHREIFSNWTPSNTISSVFLGTTNQGPVRVRFTDDFGGNTSPDPGGVGQITDPTGPFLLAGLSNAGGVAVYRDDTLIAARGTPTAAPRFFGAPYVLGSQGPLTNEFWHGDMAAILVYDRQLDEAERAATTQYLLGKYVQAVPEPSTLGMLGLGLGLGLAGLAARARRPGRT